VAGEDVATTKPASASTSFCACERDWAGPECRTRRKSQRKAFLLTLFGGFLGADYFYLGMPVLGMAKLGTLGGLGVWWLLDIVRIGAGPVYVDKYRLAADLPQWVFVLGTSTVFMLAGFLISMDSYLRIQGEKRREALASSSQAVTLLNHHEEVYGPRLLQAKGQLRSSEHRSVFAGYGSVA
jgi:TM2 domain-containing membrane protein YozV